MQFSVLLLFIIIDTVYQAYDKLSLKRERSSIAQSCFDVINEIFIKRGISFDLIFYGYQKNDLHAVSVSVDDILKNIAEQNIIVDTIRVIRNPLAWNHNLTQSAVLFFQSYEDFTYFNFEAVLANRFPKKLMFLNYLENIPHFSTLLLLPMTEELDPSSGHISLFQYYLFRNETVMALWTFEWFVEGQCNAPTLVRVDQFDLEALKWRRKLEYEFEKFLNFRGCMLVTGSDAYLLEIGYVNKYDKNIQGNVPDMFKIIAGVANFSLYHQLATVDEKSRLVHIEVNGRYQKINVFPELKALAMQNYHVSLASFQEDMVFLVSLSEMYSNYEKMAMPFDRLTWYLLIATFLTAFTVIFLVNRMPIKIQNIIYGIGIRMPAFNMIGTFFGISQSRLPSSNFPRMVLVFFVYFCLIIRTAYQGVFYDMFTTDIRKPFITSIYQMYENNFSIVTLNFSSYTNPLFTFTESNKP